MNHEQNMLNPVQLQLAADSPIFQNIPVDELRQRLGEIEKDRPVYVICQSGLRSYIASRILMGNGYDAYNFAGGFRFYDAVMNDRALIEQATACGMDRT